jgi:hypothetical protein
MPSQQSLGEFVGAMDEAGFLKRINDEIRVDQIPRILEEPKIKRRLFRGRVPIIAAICQTRSAGNTSPLASVIHLTPARSR